MFLTRLLNSWMKEGSVRIIGPDGETECAGPGASPDVTIRIHKHNFGIRFLFNPSLVVGEAYMNGNLTIEDGDVYKFLELATRNLGSLKQNSWIRWWDGIRRVMRWVNQYNPVSRARRNAAHHYDLSERLYRLFLDADLQYSCAYFEHDDMTLDEAQQAKKDHIAAKLLLDRGARILDIGCGWGGLALSLARQSDTRVTGITLSREQCSAARKRAEAAGLSAKTTFRLQDYRQVGETYDRIVSVGMLEHVGAPHYRTFFTKVRDCLATDGVALIHTIGRIDGPGSTDPWIAKYIFPGGYIPALSELMRAIEKSGLVLTDIEVLRLHYADTLRAWRRRFMSDRDEIRAIYDERFCLMWEFYLAASEVAFRNLGTVVFQIQLARRQDAVPLTRDYINGWKTHRERRREKSTAA